MVKWKDVPNYEGFYMVSECGEVKSLPRVRNNGVGSYKTKGLILKQSNTTTGYKKVELSVDGRRKSFKVHRLVAMCFIDNYSEKLHVNHIDGNPINNHVSNLEMCTQKENVIHAYKTGLIPRKIQEDAIREIIELRRKGVMARDIAEKFNICSTSVFKALKGANLKHIKKGTKYNIDKDILIKRLENESPKDIAKDIGCDVTLIYHYKRRLKEKGEIYNVK